MDTVRQRRRIRTYALALGLAGMIGIGVWTGTHSQLRQTRLPPDAYLPTTLPEKNLHITHVREGNGYRTRIIVDWKNQAFTYDVYLTPSGPRIGSVDDWYAHLTPKEKFRLLTLLGRDAPHLASYAYTDFKANWPNVKKDILLSLDELLNQFSTQHQRERR